MPPKDLPPRQTVCRWSRRFVRRLLFRTIHDVAPMLDRGRARPRARGPGARTGRGASPTAGVLDSQTVKAPAAPGGGGYDAAKRLKGRKRHVAADTGGRPLMVDLTPADVQDAHGAGRIIAAVRRRWPWLEHLFADGAYDRGRLMGRAAHRGFVAEVVRKSRRAGGAFSPCPGGGWGREDVRAG